jgi:hypothetical protein
MDEKTFWQLCNVSGSDSRMSGRSRDRLSDLTDFNFDSEIKISREQLKILIANAHGIGFTCGWSDCEEKWKKEE